MSLHDTDAQTLETATATESLPDPTLVPQRTHDLTNTGSATAVWSSIGATPFTESGLNVATISVLPGAVKRVQSDGVHWVVIAAFTNPTVTTPARAFNTSFTPSASRPVLGIYTVEISCSGLLLAGQTGRVDLLADNGAPATVRGSLRNSFQPAGALALGGASTQRAQLTFLFPPNWQGRLNSVAEVGTPTFTIVNQVEIIL